MRNKNFCFFNGKLNYPFLVIGCPQNILYTVSPHLFWTAVNLFWYTCCRHVHQSLYRSWIHCRTWEATLSLFYFSRWNNCSYVASFYCLWGEHRPAKAPQVHLLTEKPWTAVAEFSSLLFICKNEFTKCSHLRVGELAASFQDMDSVRECVPRVV